MTERKPTKPAGDQPPAQTAVEPDHLIGSTPFAPEASVLINHADVLDRIRDLALESRDVDLIDLPAPEGAIGVPARVPALVKHGATPQVMALDQFFEPHRTAPRQRAGTANVTTLASFCDLVNRHKDEHTVVFAQTEWPEPSLTAIIDYHQTNGVARFGCHRVEYEFPLTDEFKAWMANNGALLEQRDFAEFLEEHAAELTAPYDAEVNEYERLFKEKFATPNQLISLSRSLEIFVGAKIKRAERLQNGERTIIFETTHANANGDPVEIPGVFMVSVRAFVDGDPVRIPARLRYRAGGGEIKWAYQLYRPEFWLRVQVQDDLATVRQRTELPTFEGAPES